MHALIEQIQKQLKGQSLSDDDWLAVLDPVLQHFGAAVGTIHRLDAQGEFLHLVVQRGIPPMLRDTVTKIPVGKGMAGLAAQRREPVQVCNLQTDTSGAAKPGAKLTQMEGSIAVPVLVGDRLVGTLGVGKPVAHTFTPEETDLLMQIAGLIGATW